MMTDDKCSNLISDIDDRLELHEMEIVCVEMRKCSKFLRQSRSMHNKKGQRKRKNIILGLLYNAYNVSE